MSGLEFTETDKELAGYVSEKILAGYNDEEIRRRQATVDGLLGKTLRRFQHLSIDDTPLHALNDAQHAKLDDFVEMMVEIADDTYRLEEGVDRDALTKLLRRDAFALRYETEIKRLAKPENKEIKAGEERNISALVFADLDYLKRINDSYGHGVADIVLTKMAEQFNKATRGGMDAAGRLGGDEYTLLLTNIPESKAHDVIKRIFMAATDLVIAGENQDNFAVMTKTEAQKAGAKIQMEISLSMGVKELDPNAEKQLTLEGALAQTDRAAYTSKYAGRNGITFLDKDSDKGGTHFKFDGDKFSEGKKIKIREEGKFETRQEHEDYIRKQVEEALTRVLNCVYEHNNKQTPTEVKSAIGALQDNIIKICVKEK